MGDIGGPASAKGVNGLVLNIIVPGLGTILYGKTEIGVGQLVLAGLGIPMLWFSWLVALAMIAGAWIWSIVTGFQLMSSSTT
jgi:hypothetical protein